jgi:hypothetical protein
VARASGWSPRRTASKSRASSMKRKAARESSAFGRPRSFRPMERSRPRRSVGLHRRCDPRDRDGSSGRSSRSKAKHVAHMGRARIPCGDSPPARTRFGPRSRAHGALRPLWCATRPSPPSSENVDEEFDVAHAAQPLGALGDDVARHPGLGGRGDLFAPDARPTRVKWRARQGSNLRPRA